MHLADFNYSLPEDLIAQHPLSGRDQSRLLVVNREDGKLEHHKFFEILDYLNEGDLLVMNNTRVVAFRLYGQKSTGGKIEALLIKRLGDGLWEAMVKPGRRIQVGSKLEFEDGLVADVIDRTNEGGRILKFEAESGVADEIIEKSGQVPLPPYITKRLEDPNRYQTVYAQEDGSAAAPTAGLHFTDELLKKIRNKGVTIVFITLHVGISTFRPVRCENLDEHEMHSEYFEITPQSAEIINNAKGRIICVGTTTARALESAAVEKRRVAPYCGETNIFIKPPYEFKIVEGLVTNFHIPKSTLLVLVSAFAGTDLIKRAYKEAVEKKYRFLSFGDAMFLN